MKKQNITGRADIGLVFSDRHTFAGNWLGNAKQPCQSKYQSLLSVL